MKTIFDVCKFLDRIENINCGGCGIAALAMYRWLKKNNLLCGDEKFVYLYSFRSEYLFYENQKYFCGESKKMFPASHIGLFHNNRIYDSEGSVNKNGYLHSHETSVEKVLVKSLKNHTHWNDEFKRNDNINIISKTLDINLNDVKIPTKRNFTNIFGY